MKECKIIHIHDGNPVEISNGNRFFQEDFPQTEQVINDYLNQGFEVKQILPQYTPAIQEEGNLSFYKSGVLIYLERER